MVENSNITKTFDLKEFVPTTLFRSEEFADIHFVFNGNYEKEYDYIKIGDKEEGGDEEEENVEDEDPNITKLTMEKSTENIIPKIIPGHKVILAAGSNVFKQMFFGELKETKEDVEIVDVSPDGFTEFLQFFYLSKVQLTYSNIAEVIYLATKYDVPQCLILCKQFLKSDTFRVDNVCWIYKLAIRNDFEDLILHCERMIQTDTEKVFNTNDFLHCNQMVLKRILLMDVLKCSEFAVYNACMNWATERRKMAQRNNKIATKNHKEYLGECWYLIRFPVMDIGQFTKCLINCSDYFKSEDVAEIIGFIVEKRPLVLAKRFNYVARKMSFSI